MSQDKRTNKLNIYLLKNSESSFVRQKEDSTIQGLKIDQFSHFYYKKSHSNKPSWLKNFFVDTLNSHNTDNLNIFGASSSVVLIKSIIIDSETKNFAICFGQGRHLLNLDLVEDNFGLKVALNIIKHEEIRAISKKNLSAVPKQMKEQMSKLSDISDFGINIDQDLIEGITGVAKNEYFGNLITGKDSLNVSVKIDITNISNFLIKTYETYIKEDYKKQFSWINQIKYIKNKSIVDKLNMKLLNKIKNLEDESASDKVWMSVPEMIKWSDVAGFSYKKNDRNNLQSDLSLLDFLKALSPNERKNLNIEKLKSKKIFCFSASTDDVAFEWTSYKCIYAEFNFDEKMFIFTDKKWYEIAKDFAYNVKSVYNSVCNSQEKFPQYIEKSTENDYNKMVAKDNHNSYCSMDANNIMYGGGRSRIEFCDLFSSKDCKLVHVKKYGASSVLSHLFNQGLVSAESFLFDQKFREELNKKLPTSHKISDITASPKNYKIIFGIISLSCHSLDIPFFSKVSIRAVTQRLKGYGLDVSLIKISTKQK